nr:MAG TPA: protease [Caudoviricetes sp.]DAZ72888.1 MAG TPA: protease [Caudoviricetes sp.]
MYITFSHYILYTFLLKHSIYFSEGGYHYE